MPSTKLSKKQKDMELEKRFNRFLEVVKITNDYLKHIATLGSGSIVVMATFMHNFSSEDTKYSASVAIVAFTISLVSAILSHSLFVRRLSTSANDMKMLPAETIRNTFFIPTFIAYLSFIAGISFLAISFTY
jgi:hypothetical protein